MTSTIKVNKHQNACGTNIIQRCGTTTTIGSGASNTLVMDGSAVTIGRCGGTVALASGASQTGFGRTGTVDWDTTPKTATFSAVSGNGYFVNTSGGAVTANLPAGSAGAIVSFADYTRTFQTNNLTITPNGSEKIGGVAANFVAQTEGQSITLVYVDATEGWINTAESTGQAGLNPAFITATGGTITCSPCGDYKIHTFTGPGTFTVCSVGNPLGSTTVDYLVVAGGGGGGKGSTANAGGGGGAGGYREGYNPGSYTASPLATTALPITATGYPITVGAGAASQATPDARGNNGNNSIFSTITSTAGGGGGGQGGTGSAQTGGSGGGFGGGSTGCGATGNTPPVSPPQGQNGGNNRCFPGPDRNGAGGGGATVIGSGTNNPTPQAGAGGAGATTSISGSPTAYAGGGGGGPGNIPGAAGGVGGVGGGGLGCWTGGVAGTTNTGGGGGASRCGGTGAAGGSGIVIIRYKFQ
jgi:hypothetical protein